MKKIVKSITIAASPEEVWPFFTEPEKLASWFQTPRQALADGEEFYMDGEDPDDPSGAVWGRVLEMDPPRRMVWAFDHHHLNHMTRVAFDLVAKDDATEVTLTHDRFEGAPGDVEAKIRAHDDGWTPHMESLKRVAAATD